MKKTSLFSRLLTSFIIVMLIPVALLCSFYLSMGIKNVQRSLEGQVSLAVEQDGSKLASVIDDYRHKAYLVSTDRMTIDMLKRDRPEDEENRAMYNLMYSTMKGDTYLAAMHVVSASGNTRLSTQDFPSIYDLRFHTNATEQGSILLQCEGTSLTASTISLRGRNSTLRGDQIIATVIRKVYDAKGTILGYVVVEIFSEAAPFLNEDSLLYEETLIAPQVFYAHSVLHMNLSGSFEKIPDLAGLPSTAPGVYATSTQVTSIVSVQNTSLLLAGSIATPPYEENLRQWLWVFLATSVAGVIIAIIFASMFSRSIARPVKELASSMKSVEQGNLATKVKDANILEIAQLDTSFNTMVMQIKSLLALTREEETKLAEAERKALESQMNPHFLFNTLNTIKALARMHGEDEIYTITLKLGKLLRSTVDNHESECTIAESMELVDSYLTIQKIRFGEKLHVELTTDPACARAMTPKLIIQPMVENAIAHGLEPKAGSWDLKVTIQGDSDMMSITVKDNGIGFDRSSLPADLEELSGSSHVGIYNAYRRLRLRYGEKANMTIESKVGEGTTVTMVMPLILKSEDDDSEGAHFRI